MYNQKDILAALQNGEDPQAIANAFADALNGFDGDSALNGFPHPRIDVLEGMALARDACFGGTVIDGPKYAHIERTAIRTDASPLQRQLVGFDVFGRKFIDHDVCLLPKIPEAAQSGAVGL